MTKTKKRPQIKPLKTGEVIELPCGASATVKYIEKYGKRKHGVTQFVLESNGVIDCSTGYGIPKIQLNFLNTNIPLLIKTLRRVQKTK